MSEIYLLEIVHEILQAKWHTFRIPVKLTASFFNKTIDQINLRLNQFKFYFGTVFANLPRIRIERLKFVFQVNS